MSDTPENDLQDLIKNFEDGDADDAMLKSLMYLPKELDDLLDDEIRQELYNEFGEAIDEWGEPLEPEKEEETDEFLQLNNDRIWKATYWLAAIASIALILAFPFFLFGSMIFKL